MSYGSDEYIGIFGARSLGSEVQPAPTASVGWTVVDGISVADPLSRDGFYRTFWNLKAIGDSADLSTFYAGEPFQRMVSFGTAPKSWADSGKYVGQWITEAIANGQVVLVNKMALSGQLAQSLPWLATVGLESAVTQFTIQTVPNGIMASNWSAVDPVSGAYAVLYAPSGFRVWTPPELPAPQPITPAVPPATTPSSSQAAAIVPPGGALDGRTYATTTIGGVVYLTDAARASMLDTLATKQIAGITEQGTVASGYYQIAQTFPITDTGSTARDYVLSIVKTGASVQVPNPFSAAGSDVLAVIPNGGRLVPTVGGRSTAVLLPAPRAAALPVAKATSPATAIVQQASASSGLGTGTIVAIAAVGIGATVLLLAKKKA